MSGEIHCHDDGANVPVPVEVHSEASSHQTFQHGAKRIAAGRTVVQPLIQLKVLNLTTKNGRRISITSFHCRSRTASFAKS